MDGVAEWAGMQCAAWCAARGLYAEGVFALHVHARFAASHALMFRGELEALHWHDWRVEAVVVREGLDADGVVADFHEIEGDLAAVLAPFQNANLNETAPFGAAGRRAPDVNPSAEHVARHIGESLQKRLETRGEKCPKTLRGHAGDAAERSGSVRVALLSVSESPGCVAAYGPSGVEVRASA